MKPNVTIIVPVYNEVARLLTGFREITHFMNQHLPNSELVLVDDGSNEQAELILLHSSLRKETEALLKTEQLKIIRLPQNKGKGAAIARGVKESQGRYIIFTDIDCSVPMSYLPLLLDQIRKTPICIGSRRQPTSRIIIHQPFIRESAGRVYTYLANLICGLRVSDATCGFKAFQSAKAKKIFAHSCISRWSFDAEILFLARKFRYDIAEIPVAWSDKTGSRVKSSDSFRSFLDLLIIRLHDIQGGYDKKII